MSTDGDDRSLQVLRLRALIVAVPAVLLIGAVAYLLLDPTLERAVEDAGAAIVGAKVEVDAADVRVAEGRFILQRLQVANPEAPFTNLLEVREIVIDVRTEPLLEKKLVADSVLIRGIRFGTPRESSGALLDPSPESGRLWRELNAWADSLDLPSFTLEGLGGVVNVAGIDDDSLSTLVHGRALIDAVDSTTTAWQSRIRGLDPRPVLDSARALTQRVEALQPTPVGVIQAAQLIRSARTLVSRLEEIEVRVLALDDSVRADVASLRTALAAFPTMLQVDMAYGRRLLRLPSLEAPNLAPTLFREPALAWLKPVLYWVHTAERHLPPGLDPARLPGPKRQRAPGTTVTFPGRAHYPRFLLEYGALDLEIGGTGLSAGRYTGAVRGLTSAPALYGKPIEIVAGRSLAARGPDELSLRAVLHHGARPVRDSVELRVGGVTLPTLDLAGLDARLHLGHGAVAFSLSRIGDDIDARLRWTSSDIRWERLTELQDDPSAPIGSERWARAFLWRSLAGVTQIEVDMGLRGSLSSPSLWIQSDLGEAVARSLREEVGVEVQRAERQLRAEIDRRVQPVITEARAQTDLADAWIAQQIGPLADEIPEVRQVLETAVERWVLRRGGAP